MPAGILQVDAHRDVYAHRREPDLDAIIMYLCDVPCQYTPPFSCLEQSRLFDAATLLTLTDSSGPVSSKKTPMTLHPDSPAVKECSIAMRVAPLYP